MRRRVKIKKIRRTSRGPHPRWRQGLWEVRAYAACGRRGGLLCVGTAWDDTWEQAIMHANSYLRTGDL